MASLSSRIPGALAACALLGAAFWPATARAGERELWSLWTLHAAAASNGQHEAVADACRRFEAADPESPFLPVSRGLAAWHRLAAGQIPQAQQILETMLTATNAGPVAQAGATMAQRWLTRLDHDSVKRALRAYYAERVRFPNALSDLRVAGAAADLPMTDRWGKPWQYRLGHFRKVQGAAGQRYECESTVLGSGTDLAVALRRPYAAGIGLVPRKMMAGDDQRPTVLFRIRDPPARDVVLTEGTAYESVSLAAAGPALLILTDGDCWLVLPRPEKGE